MAKSHQTQRAFPDIIVVRCHFYRWLSLMKVLDADHLSDLDRKEYKGGNNSEEA